MQAQTINLSLDGSELTDSIGEFWQGSPLRIRVLATTEAGAIRSDVETGAASMTLVVSRVRNSDAALMAKTVLVGAFGSPTSETWAGGTAEHALFEFSAAETNVNMLGEKDVELWLAVRVTLSSGDSICIGGGRILCREDGLGGTLAAPLTRFDTSEEVDAKIAEALSDVEAGNISDGGVTTAKLADGAVTNAKVASDAAIAQSKIAGLTSDLAGKASSSHTHAFSELTSKPTTVAGYGITDAVTKDGSGNVTVAGELFANVLGGTISDGTDFQTPSETRLALGLGNSATKDVGTGSDQVAAGNHTHTGTYATASHTHAISDVNGLQTALDGKAASTHTHAISDVTGLQTALDGKASTSHTHTGTYQPLDADLTALAALSGTGVIYYRSAADTWSAVTIGSGLNFSGGTLTVSGSPTVTTITADSHRTTSSSFNAQTGTSYTLQSTDNGKIVTLNNASAITLTVPSGLGAGFSCTLIQLGAGQVTVTPSSTTVNARVGLKLAGQHAMAMLVARAADTFSLGGDLSA